MHLFNPFLGQEPNDFPGGNSRGSSRLRGGRGGPEDRGVGIGYGGGGRGFGGGRGVDGDRWFGGRGCGFRGRGRWCDNEKETFVLSYTHYSYTLWIIKITCSHSWVLESLYFIHPNNDAVRIVKCYGK